MDRDGLLSEVASVEIQILPDAKTERIHALESVLRALPTTWCTARVGPCVRCWSRP